MSGSIDCYRCPGESYTITRAVHLARLTTFYPACRACQHRTDTGSLSLKVVEQLAELDARRHRANFFDDEGLSGVELNELDARVARRAATAFGTTLRQSEETLGHGACVVLGGDGRPLGAELVEAAAEGLRLAGCDVVDIGPGTSASLIGALAHLQATGGLLVGNAPGAPHTASLRFWSHLRGPLSRGAGLEALESQYDAAFGARPARTYGSLRRFSAESLYLDSLGPCFHALRPLRIGFRCASRPLAGWVRRLSQNAACRFFTPSDAPPEAALHATVSIDGDGEQLWVCDEHGRPVDGERLLVAMARIVLEENPGRTVVLDENASAESEACIAACGGRVVRCGKTRAAAAASMREHAALLGGGTSGRYWFAGPSPLPDALRGLSLLLSLLSGTDRPLSGTLADCYH